MNKTLSAAFGGGLLITVVACGSTDAPERTMTLQGALSAGSVHTDNARAIAVSDTGNKYWSYLTGKGTFSVKVPIGHAYRLVIANQMAGAGR